MSKRRGKSKSQRKQQRAQRKGRNDVVTIPDRRAIEGVMRGHLAQFMDEARDTPLARAQDLVYQAFDVDDPDERMDLAKQALELSPDCADAYVLLAEHARTVREALEVYEKGVAAGERALGEQAFAINVGHFWGILETRPYMRARLGLAESLWSVGRRDEAIAHLQDMLRLNPNDNQGIRDILPAWYLLENRDAELARLLEQYEEDSSACFAYTKALLAFRQNGDTVEARRLLQEAKRVNKHVRPYLLDEKPIPLQLPEYYSHGDPREAAIYAHGYVGCWRQTPGAVNWLCDVFETRATQPPSEPSAIGPLPIVLEQLRRLPQQPDIWQADCRQLPIRLEHEGVEVEPYMILVTNRSKDLIVGQNIFPHEPTPGLFWDTIFQIMRRPLKGKAWRPSELQMLRTTMTREFAPHLESLGIRCALLTELDQLDFVFNGLSQVMGGEPIPGLLETPGVTPGLVAGCFEAAAEFYQNAPWKRLPFEAAIQVKCDKFPGGPRYAVGMGQSGLSIGLVLYDDLDLLVKTWRGQISEKKHAREMTGLSVSFHEELDIPDADVEAIREYDWEVAGPAAYPHFFRKERGNEMRPPLPWELQLMEACLRAIPEFTSRRPFGDSATEKMTVNTGTERVDVELRWVEE